MFFISGHSFTFEQGKSHKYSYSTKVVFNELNSGARKDVGYYLTTEFDLSQIFQTVDVQLIKLQVNKSTGKLDFYHSLIAQEQV